MMFRISDAEIIKILDELKSKPLTSTSHLYQRFLGKSIDIGQAAKIFSKEYGVGKDRPAIALLEVIMSAHRNYTKQVEPHINRIKQTPMKSFSDLKQKLNELSREQFYVFWGAKDLQKYELLQSILVEIDGFKKIYDIDDDYTIMNKWATMANIKNYKVDEIGKLKNIGLATFQHLRMIFGADTVKPDQRVKEVLLREFSFSSSNDINLIQAVEYIAKITGLRVLEVDQIFVNYGSGYYNKIG